MSTTSVTRRHKSGMPGKRAAARGERSLSNTSRILSLEEGCLASKARKRIELLVAPRSKPGSVELPNSVAPPTATEHAMIEAAIQLDLITPEQAKALVEKGKTLGEWLMEQEKGKAGETRKVGQTMLDRMGLLALLLFNFAVLVGIGWIVFRVVRSL
jgi:hypothetical protein